ncbi:MAG: SagB/ThcOx family dehydrogenase [Microcystis aeruginosa Ma_QC_B_20070730_S2]|uniref:SagB/ThcOx family dehydrogenase n=1 Tax=Microcystis aeruginosa Ma_QC_B_20070730_S2 TaxID=2486256 RepID=A0A552DPD8_MICAE|nr:MAG: SagB/ThcOx family dehydrogenase [Microcystis aeruginosa Ma_QC_B_20070730_S2]
MPDQPISIAQYYHERTKYDPQTIASKSKGLDWSQQPHPFKEYKIGQTFDLKPYLSRQTVPQKGDFWRRISRILGCSYGLTAKIATMGSPLYLRSAPSAGGLYPAEVYLISRGTEFLPAGLYSYQGQSHSLLLFWESDVWTNLQSACFWNPVLENTDIALVTSAIFYRSAWRYEDRAYRRIFLDTGHLLGNIELSASINDYRAHLIGGFNDSQMNELLYLDSEKESVMTVIPLADLLNIRQNLPPSTTALPSTTTTLYPKIAEGELLNSLHQATIIATDEKIEANITPSNWEDKYNFPFCLKVSVTSRPVNWGEDLIDLESTMLKRRSTRAYSGASLSLDELRALLHFTYQPQDYADQNLDPNPDYFDLDLLETFIAVSAVTGLEEGCYYYAPKAQELRQIRFKNFRQELHYLCLGQDLGRDAAAVVFHTADLSKAVAKYGDRVYRYLHADAGHLGQRLNLAAIHLGLGVSGIGGFFDDQVNEVLGIPSDEAVIYITTLGRPKVF